MYAMSGWGAPCCRRFSFDPAGGTASSSALRGSFSASEACQPACVGTSSSSSELLSVTSEERLLRTLASSLSLSPAPSAAARFCAARGGADRRVATGSAARHLEVPLTTAQRCFLALLHATRVPLPEGWPEVTRAGSLARFLLALRAGVYSPTSGPRALPPNSAWHLRLADRKRSGKGLGT